MVSDEVRGGCVFIVVLCLTLAMGLVQVVRPQLLRQMNRRLRRGRVKDPDGTEPTRKAGHRHLTRARRSPPSSPTVEERGTGAGKADDGRTMPRSGGVLANRAR
ncbi:DUF6199 family natural product biosynthesis protein [Actinacidiphila alni]|uniref:DUF6199 family natural product biosynthesis protein n=1 Tax=Actinacidiphila alni TaxID=380248 RepID=UPI00345477A9